MKYIKYIATILVAALLVSCSPEVELRDFGPDPSGEIKVDKIDGNNFNYSFEGQDAFLLNWFFDNGIHSQEQELDVYFPFKGEYDNKLLISGGPSTVELNHKLVVENTDPAICEVPELKMLTGGCEGEGKTWVFATDRPDSNPFAGSGVGLHFFMVDPADWTVFWWNAGDPGSGGSVVSDINAEMTFDLNGGFNYTYMHDGEVKTGSFTLDLDKQTLSINGADLVGAYGTYLDNTKGGKYELKKLSDDELILFQTHGEGFCWIFKPKGHDYN
ncbi:hypothetical protein KEM09_05635 [Carboxylicivirga mesophila]|uniref:Lipoprotein n=1 Tax=Carboxylicivirga mesophila TaxID=1166478 RepID=A0ABS5K794_9BACT|nr:hypothetical protein [Carboxylicivirga mesophila]MBS2210869.1 hypothetical protein [Carboxylicivirga mesophila]